MNRIFLYATLVLLAGGVYAADDRPTKKQFKGVELYSWQDPKDGWVFALLPGTNALKKEEWIKSEENKIVGVKELEKRFFDLAEGENVYWVFTLDERQRPDLSGVPRFGLPDKELLEQVKQSAEKAKIDLVIAQVKRANHSLERTPDPCRVGVSQLFR